MGREAGYLFTPPCLWGSPEDGLLPPPVLFENTTLQMLTVFNSTYDHPGQMGIWQMKAAPVGHSRPSPTPPAPTPGPASGWSCSVCQHIYDPEKDGNGVKFEDLPATWKCPICGAPKSAYKRTTSKSGATQWVHDHN